MSSIIKTRTQGFRVSTFRNQEVHKYYSHLQSVMRTIDSNGTYNELFAKPEIDAMAVGETEIEWTCSGNGKAVHISQLSESERNRFEKMVSDAFTHIEAYIAENRTKSGKNRDYAQFLSIVGKRPDSNQIWVINGKPIIVQWGFVDENGLMGSSGIYSDWDSFIKDIRKVEPEKPKEEPVMVVEEPAKTEPLNEAVVAAPAAASSLFAEQEKPAEPVPQPKPEEPKAEPVEKQEEPAPKKVDTEEKKTVYAGLGGYEWVKWVAILLAIIILLLLLLRLLFPPKFPNDLLGQNGTNIGAINGGGMGGSGGGSDGGGAGGGDNGAGGNGAGSQGGDNGAGGQNGGGNPAVNPNEPCPVCSKPFGNHGPEDYKKCIRQASKGNGAGGQGGANGAGSNGGAQGGSDGAGSNGGAKGGSNGAENGAGLGSPAGSDQNGITGGEGQGSPSGAGASNGGGQGGSDGASSNGGGQGGSDGAGSNGGAKGGSNGAENGAGSGSPAGLDQNGITGGVGQGSPSGTNGNGENGIPCDSCGGSGVDTNTGKPCPTCDGTGNGSSGSPAGSDQKGITGGAGQGNPSGANGAGENAGESGNSEGNGIGSGNNDKSASNGEKGSGDEKAVEPSKQQKDDNGFNPEDVCPVCSRQFKIHSEEDLKNCILASQRDKIEVQKKFERLKSATTNYNKAVKELNSENSADNIGEK